MRSRVGAALVGAAIVATACAGTASTDCVPQTDPGVSVARLWNEETLDAIRRDEPVPPVHARNLFHVSVAMWDAWAAYDDSASPYLADERATARDVVAARREAISYAAFGVLRERFAGSTRSIASFQRLLVSLCLSPSVTSRVGSSPSAVGNRIADTVLAAGEGDGADYLVTDYASPNVPLPVTASGTRITEPNVWQPLFVTAAFDEPTVAAAQGFMTPHWGGVEAFSVSEPQMLDPGPPPRLGDQATDTAFKDAVVELIQLSGQLDPTVAATIDIGPGSRGGNGPDDYAGRGHDVNAITGEPYRENLASEGDYGRVLTEFWGDGPDEETPPGHWNLIANMVSDDPLLEHRIGGEGPVVDRLEWDVKLYLALNGALHDAAVAAWWTKLHYEYVRPISMIRHMGGLGQSSEPSGPAYHPAGLPLVPGAIEVVTEESSTPGARHSDLADHVGEIAIHSWAGPAAQGSEPAGVAWILAVDWMPYQDYDFVTPPFPGYVSGHSTFSRAAAQILEAMTGSPYFPGGLASWTVTAGSLRFDDGPSADVTLQWATYADAADEAGLSRLYGGVHVRADDLGGRFVGILCGRSAWALARSLWEG